MIAKLLSLPQKITLNQNFYDTKEILTSLGIGEALISALDEKGRPTPLAATLLRAPMSRMDILTDNELKSVIKGSNWLKNIARL